MRYLLLLALLAPLAQAECIVYTRVPRTLSTEVVRISTGAVKQVKHLDARDSLPEVGRQFSRFNAPGQLVIHCDGKPEKIIHDCVTGNHPCVPFDASVSLDGKKIIYAVYRANGIENTEVQGWRYPNRKLSTDGNKSELAVYDIASETTLVLPYVEGRQETSPIYLPDNKIMFSSDRDGQYGPYLHNVGADETTTPRLFIMDSEGVRAVGPHSMGGTMHPYLLSNGRVAETTKWMTHNLPYIYNNGSVNYPTTMANMWVLQTIDQRGGDPTALYGSHQNDWVDKATGKKMVVKTAMHYIGQRANGDVLAATYYRANNMGLGDIVGFTLEPKLLEGPAPMFLPTNRYTVAGWSTAKDVGAGTRTNGKIGFPEGLPDGQVMLTFGRGWCSTVNWDDARTPAQIDALGKVGCDAGIYKTSVIPSRAFTDLVKVVDLPEWHEFGARLVAPRTIAPADLINTDDGSCQIASSDAGSTDAHRRKPYDFNSGENMKSAANNGTEIDGLDHSELAAIRFYQLIPNTSRRTDPNNSIGNKVLLLGDVPLLSDKSFKAQLPCDTPFFMVGLDSQGRAIKRDQLPQSLRQGELRVCEGCHLHGSKGRPWADSLAHDANPKVLSMPVSVPTYEAEVKPILDARCKSCHATGVPLFDFDKLVWDFFQKYVPEGSKVVTGIGSKKYALQRPYTSKYVHTQFARESLLYWKAANERMDGRTDATYSDDIDFGAAHPTEITPDELKVIAGWLDSGATK